MPPKPKWTRCPSEPTVRERDGKFIIDQRYRPRSGKEVKLATSTAFDTKKEAVADKARWRLYVENGFASVAKRRRAVTGTAPVGAAPSGGIPG